MDSLLQYICTGKRGNREEPVLKLVNVRKYKFGFFLTYKSLHKDSLRSNQIETFTVQKMCWFIVSDTLSYKQMMFEHVPGY